MQLMKLYQGNEAAKMTQFSKVTIHNGISYWTGHVALKPGDTYQQARSALNRYDVFLPMFGQSKSDLLHGMAFVRDIVQYSDFLRAWREWFAADGQCPPALTCVQADLVPGHNVEICFIAGYDRTPSGCRITAWPRPEGDYSECVVHNGFARFSAVTAEGRPLGAADQLKDILAQYERMFIRYGLDKERILMANFYLRDADDYEVMKETWSAWVGREPPALMVQQAAPPEGKKLALSLILAADEEQEIQRLERQQDRSACVKYHGVAYLSAVTADGSGTANEEGREVFQKIDAMLARFGLDKRNVYFNQMFGENFPDFNEFDVGAFKDWSVKSGIYPAAIGFASPPPDNKAIAVSVIVAYE